MLAHGTCAVNSGGAPRILTRSTARWAADCIVGDRRRSVACAVMAAQKAIGFCTGTGTASSSCVATRKVGGVAAAIVNVMLARCPPAEKPSTPTRTGSMRHAFAWSRVSRTACLASSNGDGYRYDVPSSDDTPYLHTIAATPIEFNHCAICHPSWSMARTLYPPPGKITIAVPVARDGGGRNTRTSGVCTCVTSATGSFADRTKTSATADCRAPGGGPGYNGRSNGARDDGLR